MLLVVNPVNSDLILPRNCQNRGKFIAQRLFFRDFFGFGFYLQ